MTAPIRVGTDGVAPIALTPAPDRLLSGTGAQTIWNAYTDPSGRFSVGLWESEAGCWRVHYTEDEACHLLSGRIILRGDDGSQAEFGPGDSFVIPAGFAGTWEVVGHARKLYAIHEGAAEPP